MHKPVLTICLLSSLLPTASADTLFRESDLGSLFTSPVERRAIDRQRQGETHADGKPGRGAPSQITVNGMVKNSAGKQVVWVNGHSLDGRRSVDGIRLLSAGGRKPTVVLRVDGKTVRVKPGESWSEAAVGQ